MKLNTFNNKNNIKLDYIINPIKVIIYPILGITTIKNKGLNTYGRNKKAYFNFPIKRPLY